MIVVGGGRSSRFGGDKLMEDAAGRPLVAHTVEAVRALSDVCVLVIRPDLVERIETLSLGVQVVPGGSSRTLSEMAGLVAVGEGAELIGIHDAARPLVSEDLINHLYKEAARVGGAVPILDAANLLVDRRNLKLVERPVRVQTPQVFRGPGLMTAYVKAAEAGYDGHDTVDIVHRFGDLDIAGVPGDPENVKVTFPEDLELVRKSLGGPART